MDPSSLPRYPRATPPAATPVPPVAGRGWVMLLQLLFLVAVWGGIYAIREQALAFKRAEAKRAYEGKWQLTRVPEVVLELREGWFRFSRDRVVFFDGEYSRSGDTLSLRTLSGTGYSGFWSVQYELAADELALWGVSLPMERSDFALHTLTEVLGREAAVRIIKEEQERPFKLRFRRVSE